MEPSSRPLWGWPGLGKLVYAYGVLGPPLLVWFVFIYVGADYLTGLHDFRVRLHWAVELGMPFVPAMVVFYNSMHVAYLIAPFILRTRPEMHAMAVTWVLITLCGGVVFLLLPSEDAFPAPPDSALGPWRGMFRLADQANLRFNSCPSLHVTWAIVCVDVYARWASPLSRLWLWSWGIGMVLSTLLLHQHHLADAVGGVALASLGSRLFYPRLLDHFRRGRP
ncbi:MAG: phosphatase PAP2 family protein [Planctomycetes bacterium]|nr:phosphatase PAP2 family protein [Planctomycetota bacterium]